MSLRSRELPQARSVDRPLECGGRHDEARRDREPGGGHRREARPFSAGDANFPAGLLVEPDEGPRYSSSRIATARTGAAVVPIHLIGKTDSLNPCEGS